MREYAAREILDGLYRVLDILVCVLFRVVSKYAIDAMNLLES